MGNFSVKNEIRKPVYNKKSILSRRGKNILALALAVVVLTPAASLSAGEEFTKGKVALRPIINEKYEVTNIVEGMMKKALGIRFKPDVPLSLTNGGLIMDFIADGYNKKLKLAYEWVSGYDTTNETGEYLSMAEERWITNYRFGDTSILWIYARYPFVVTNIVNEFIGIYTNQKEK